jgi:uncharacterized membrane protein
MARKTATLLLRIATSLSALGLFLGTLFFAASLTPSLIPRSATMQGVLAGACFAIGYGLGVFWRLLWAYLQLPEPQNRLRFMANSMMALTCLAAAIWFLWQSAGWQNSVRTLVGMEPVARTHAVSVCAIALATFAVLIGLARLFLLAARRISRASQAYVPKRVANVLGVVAAALLFWSVANDLLARSVFSVLDSSFAEFNALIEPERPAPTDPDRTGGPASLLNWGDLGRAGREFIAGTPTAAEISAVIGKPAMEPLRVYVGLPSAASPEERARLALEELKRTGGFDRSMLVVVTPTGTGWVDPAAMEPIEYLSGGDIASVAMQYSYLSSPLSLLAEPEYGAEAAAALFGAVYRYWTTLPTGERPRLYLHGLSLGAMNSEKSAELFEILADPIHGALWSGPPFASRHWKRITRARNPGSPQWLPEFRDGGFVRFMNQNGPTVPPSASWGPMRIVYLQYASDAIVFFDYDDFYRRPDWMAAPRGPDVSPELGWYPVVTMLQIALDMAFATTTPMGYGHVYAPEHYVNAWLEVADFNDWSPEAIAVLKKELGAKLRAGTLDRIDENRGG